MVTLLTTTMEVPCAITNCILCRVVVLGLLITSADMQGVPNLVPPKVPSILELRLALMELTMLMMTLRCRMFLRVTLGLSLRALLIVPFRGM